MPFPTIDLSPYLRAPFPSDQSFPSAEQRDIARVVDACFRGVGILFVRDIALTTDVLSAMNEVSKRLFAIPDDEKRESLMPMKKGTNMGYLPFSIEALNADRGPDIKEVRKTAFVVTICY